jgi:hypothetical protein
MVWKWSTGPISLSYITPAHPAATRQRQDAVSPVRVCQPAVWDWKAASSKAEPRSPQDWIMKCVCRVGETILSRPVGWRRAAAAAPQALLETLTTAFGVTGGPHLQICSGTVRVHHRVERVQRETLRVQARRRLPLLASERGVASRLHLLHRGGATAIKQLRIVILRFGTS